MRCPDDREGSCEIANFWFHDFRCAHVDEFQVSFVVNHDILRLDVSIDDVVRMEVFQSEDQWANVELWVRSTQQTDFSNHIK